MGLIFECALTTTTPQDEGWTVDGARFTGSTSPPAAREIPRARAFSAKQLAELPRAGWLMNGGNLANQR